VKKRKKPSAWSVLPKGARCAHRRMTTCCSPVDCGHYYCPDCGLLWDDHAGM
jgi:hypothetical protein